MAKVTELLNNQPDLIHVRNADREKWQQLTALHCAALHGHLDMANSSSIVVRM